MRPAVDLSHMKMSFLTLFTSHILMKYIAIDQTDGPESTKRVMLILSSLGFIDGTKRMDGLRAAGDHTFKYKVKSHIKVHFNK